MRQKNPYLSSQTFIFYNPTPIVSCLPYVSPQGKAIASFTLTFLCKLLQVMHENLIRQVSVFSGKWDNVLVKTRRTNFRQKS